MNHLQNRGRCLLFFVCATSLAAGGNRTGQPGADLSQTPTSLFCFLPPVSETADGHRHGRLPRPQRRAALRHRLRGQHEPVCAPPKLGHDFPPRGRGGVPFVGKGVKLVPSRLRWALPGSVLRLHNVWVGFGWRDGGVFTRFLSPLFHPQRPHQVVFAGGVPDAAPGDRGQPAALPGRCPPALLRGEPDPQPHPNPPAAV